VLVDTHTASQAPAEWDIDELAKALTAMGLSGPGTTPDDLADAAVSRDALREHLEGLTIDALDAKEALYGDEAWGLAERFVLLRTIDSLWVEHLTEIDDMRRGIGLRGYAQQDPLNEFRKEAYRLYEELRDLIRRQVATTILRVNVTREPAPQTIPLPGPGQPARPVAGGVATGAVSGGGPASPLAGMLGSVTAASATAPAPEPDLGTGGGTGAPRRPAGNGNGSPVSGPLPADPMRGVRETSSNGGGGSPDGVKPGYTPSGARIGRNDPCWCGSGNKYKKCHGK